MATNPRIPEQNERRGGPTLVPKPEKPGGAGPGVALAIITALLLLGAILYFMPRNTKNVSSAPANAVTPSQPSPGQLQFSEISMTPAPLGGSLSIDAQLTNSGSTDVNGVMAEIDFSQTNGQTKAVQAPVMGVAVTKKAANTSKVTGDTEDLTKAPIKPGETRPVRITVNDVPSDWNHQTPRIRIADTTATTTGK